MNAKDNPYTMVGSAINELVKACVQTGVRPNQISEIVKAVRDDLKDAIQLTRFEAQARSPASSTKASRRDADTPDVGDVKP